MCAKDLRRIARESLVGNWWLSVLVAFLAAIFGSLLTSSDINFDIDTEVFEKMSIEIPVFATAILVIIGGFTSTLSLVVFILGGTVQLGYVQYLLKQQNREPLEVKDLFSQFHRFKEGFLQSLLRAIFTTLWALLFIIPGIIKTYSYSMTPFIMADNPNMTAKEAITASKNVMDGHKFDLFCLELSFIGWDLLNLLTLGIGSFFLNPYKNAAFAAFYSQNIRPQMAPAAYITEEGAVAENTEAE